MTVSLEDRCFAIKFDYEPHRSLVAEIMFRAEGQVWSYDSFTSLVEGLGSIHPDIPIEAVVYNLRTEGEILPGSSERQGYEEVVAALKQELDEGTKLIVTYFPQDHEPENFEDVLRSYGADRVLAHPFTSRELYKKLMNE